MKKETTSNETSTASSVIIWSEMNYKATKSVEFFTKDDVFPTSGDSISGVDVWTVGKMVS